MMRDRWFPRVAVLVLLLGALVVPAAAAQDSTSVLPSRAGSVQPRVPSNDNFASAWSIGQGSGTSDHTNAGATTEGGEQLTCETHSFGATTWYWYRMTATVDSTVTVDTRGADFDTVLAVYTGSSLPSLTRVTCNDDIAGTDLDSEVQFTAVPSTTYWIQVGGHNGATGHYPLHITRTPLTGPVNDDFAHARALGGNLVVWNQVTWAETTVQMSTTGATTEASEWLGPCQGAGFGATVWFSFTVAEPSTMLVHTQYSSFDTVLAIYSGAASPTYVTCDDDHDSDGTSRVEFTAVPGINYWIQVGGDNGATGDLDLRILRMVPPPVNDSFANAWNLGLSQAQNTAGATYEEDEPLTCAHNMGATVWYKMMWADQTAGPITVDTRGSNFDTVLAVYTGSSVGSLTQVACNDNRSLDDLDSEVQFTAQPGVQYWIQVGGYGGETGNLQLHASWEPVSVGYFCRGRPATLVGTAGNDVLYGTAGIDVIVGLGGNDLIYGYGSKDYICAGPGRDVVYGGTGNDRILGDAGDDQLHGQAGNDRIFGRLGDDVIFGEMGDDRLRGNGGYDTLRGDLGYDQCKTGEDVICEVVIG